ncbi:NAD(P)H-dependent flavin oxidoreductase [Vibrio sp. E150_011]
MQNIHELLGSRFPIIQAPMAGVQNNALAIAVNKAGGLGSIPCGMLGIEAIVTEIKTIRAATSRPYNLNFFCHDMPQYDVSQHQHWQQTLSPFLAELNIDKDTIPKNANRMPFNHDIADAIEPFVPEIISFHFGLPDKTFINRIKSWGTRIISTATTVKEAQWLEQNGADAIIVQGLEAGGHRGMFLTKELASQAYLSILLPNVIANVNIPVIAAGGITDQKDMENALALGAQAVQVGTVFLLCSEATTSDLHRAAIKNGARNRHTALTNIFTGRPARGIVNRAMERLGYINENAPTFPYASLEMGLLRASAEKKSLSDFSPLWCGENTAGCAEVSAQVIIDRLMGQP